MSNDLEPIDSSRQLLSQHVIQQQDQDRAVQSLLEVKRCMK